MHFNLLSHVCSSRWDIAFIDEKLDDILSLNSIQFKIPTNPYAGKQWFADPFILDVTDDKIYLLVEEMHSDLNKGRIAKLTIEKDKWLISKVDILLEEPWHLSFPFIIRKNGKIYVAPESAKAGAWYLYELITDGNGNEKLRRIKQLCDKVVWDSIITECFNEPLMLTCCQNDFYLDIFKKNTEDDAIYSYHESIRSKGMFYKLTH